VTFDYVANFPISEDRLPQRLRTLLEPVSLDPRQKVEVACIYEHDPYGADAEHVHLQTAVVQDDSDSPIGVINEAGQGVVEYSVPAGGKGCASDFSPTLSGHDYIVAAWGSGSFFSFNLAEKVWMTLGLTPRCVGNNHQRVIYDDLGLPEFGVVDGEISNEYFWQPNRNISWKMSNEYLRRYLWLRGARGVRTFFYQKQFPRESKIRDLLGETNHVVLKPEDGPQWYTLDIREHNDGLLVQLWASVGAITRELCGDLHPILSRFHRIIALPVDPARPLN